ncbi:cytochrome P450 [Actinoplanes sp. NPDC051861]|uniref:cytochrome P450 n=1 Tax=Actinoplanes sp. NPDC051861 TaxID=3155170 RepID=UPI0034380F16
MTSVDSGRKVDRGEREPGCPVRVDGDGVWHIQDYATARQFLRHTDTRQAGLGIENALRLQDRMRLPVLYRDGAEHREHRRQTAKYFTPRRVESAYRDLMHRLADEQCEVLRRRGAADLSSLSFHLAVAVAAEVVGLTDSRGDMARRLDRFFRVPDPNARGLRAARQKAFNNFTVFAFFWRDVRPAIAARRRTRRDDLISHLIDEGCTAPEILGECVTFAAAGMVTTREFISVAAWHLLTDEALRDRYVTGDETERVALLHEILRLEPVVADLLRWTTADVTLGDVTIPSGAKVDVGVAAANLDTGAVGPEPAAVCPGRPLSDGVADAGLSFGDGAHRCPGAYIAIQETDIFLSKLFAMPNLRLIQEPTVTLRPDIASYELKGMILAA